jgi:hypothetical protein
MNHPCKIFSLKLVQIHYLDSHFESLILYSETKHLVFERQCCFHDGRAESIGQFASEYAIELPFEPISRAVGWRPDPTDHIQVFAIPVTPATGATTAIGVQKVFVVVWQLTYC